MIADGEGEFIGWTVLFNDLGRGRPMVATIYSDALFELAMYPVCKAFDIDQLAQDKLSAVEYPSGIVLGLAKTAIRREAGVGERRVTYRRVSAGKAKCSQSMHRPPPHL